MSADTTSPITAEHREAFTRDGVVKIEQAVNLDWVDQLLSVVEDQLADPGDWISDSNPGATVNRLFTTRYLWQDEPTIRKFIFESGVAGMVGELLDTAALRFYFDHTLVKEPGTTAPTPWHQDIPYWPFLGKKIASAWVSLSTSTVNESSLEFVRGSHNWDVYYAPESFAEGNDWMDDFKGEPVPDIQASREDFDIIGFDVEPGDALIFSAWCLHGAPGNAGPNRRAAFSTRWLGDDSLWSPHPGSDPTITADNVSVQPGNYPDDDNSFPAVWTRE